MLVPPGLYNLWNLLSPFTDQFLGHMHVYAKSWIKVSWIASLNSNQSVSLVWWNQAELKQCDGIWTEGWNDGKYDRHSHTLQYMYGYLTCHIQGETYTELNVYRLLSRWLSKQLVVNRAILYIWLNLLHKVAIRYSLR